MTFADQLVAMGDTIKDRTLETSGLERQRLHALADVLYAEARTQGATVKRVLVMPAGFSEVDF